MARSYTNFILHTTSFIYQKKRDLLVEHLGMAWWDTLTLIVAEVFLAIISIPLYLLVSPNQAASGQYRVRHLITRSLIIGLAVVWLLKLALIIGASSYAYRQDQVFQTGHEQALIDQLTTEITIAPTGKNLSAPHISSVQQHISGELIATGTSAPGSIVALYLSKEVVGQASNLKLYSAQTNIKGTWTITEDRQVFALPPGTYDATALRYDEHDHLKSALSNAVSIKIQQPLIERLFISLDTILNISIIALLLLGLAGSILLGQEGGELNNG